MNSNLSQANRDASNITPEQKHGVLLLMYQSVHHMLFNFTETTCQQLQSLKYNDLQQEN
jgi:hypothetical protein